MLLFILLLASRNFTILNNIIVEFFLLLKLSKRIYNKASLLLLSNQTIRSSKTINRFNYKNLNRRNKFKDYTHIIRVFCALFINNSLSLFSARVSKTLDLSITKSQFYKKTYRLLK